MTQDPFTAPVRSGSGAFSPSEHVGALVLIAVRKFHPGIQSAYGIKDAIESAVDIIDHPRRENIGTAFDPCMLYGSAMVPDLAGQLGMYVLGRLQAVQGRNPSPAVILAEPSEPDKQMARDYLRSTPLRSLEPAPDAVVQQTHSQHAQAFNAMRADPWASNQGQQPQPGGYIPAPGQQPPH